MKYKIGDKIIVKKNPKNCSYRVHDIKCGEILTVERIDDCGCLEFVENYQALDIESVKIHNDTADEYNKRNFNKIRL